MSIFTPYRTLVPYLKRYWRQYCGGLICLLGIIGGQLLIPQYIRLAVDTLTFPKIEDGVARVIRYMSQMVGVTLGIVVARFGWRHFLAITARKIETELRDDMYAKITTLSHDFYTAYPTGDLIARLTNDLRAIRMACGFAIVSIVDGVVMSVAIIVLLFSRYPDLTLYMLVPLLPISVVVFFSGRIITARYTKVQDAFSTLTEHARHTLTNMRTIKTYGKEKYFTKKFSHHVAEYKKHTLKYSRFWSLVFPLVLLLATCSHLLLIIFGGRRVLAGEITVGDFVSIIAYLEMLLWPMVGLGFTINLFAQGTASLKRVNKILHATPLIHSKADARGAPKRFDIKIRNLYYAYSTKKERTLSDISMDISATDHVGIIGRTASGKSTFVQLLPRLLDPPAHTIFIDGRDIREYPLPQLRKSICVVTQRPFLFSESIEHNVNFSVDDPKKRNDDFHRIIKAAAIDTHSVEFPRGLETEIGENGVMISEGQKQRIAIARAMMYTPPILIFDDTFSALDAETEQQVLHNIVSLRKNQCTIFISNRVKSLEQCDFIYVLDNGTIVQEGRYDTLIEKQGLFHDLYLLQVPEAFA